MNNDDFVGYFEIIFKQDIKDSEIAYFGILEEYFGKKYGGYLLSEAIEISFKGGSKRVWVHTCSFDHKYGIKNYIARGNKLFNSSKSNAFAGSCYDCNFLSQVIYHILV